MPVTEPPYSLSARALLEIASPYLGVKLSGQVRDSSLSNANYSNINQLQPLTFPGDLAGYYALPNNELYHPVQVDRTLNINVESDAIRACHSHILGPVNMVLANNLYVHGGAQLHITSKSEAVHATANGEVTRVDLSYQVVVEQVSYTFAVVEFKRPGALDLRNWEPAMRTPNPGPVIGRGRKICRQLVKYGHAYGIRFVAACITWDAMMLLYLSGSFDDMHKVDGTGTVPARYKWINDQTDMKRNLYVFLRLALRMFLSEHLNITVRDS